MAEFAAVRPPTFSGKPDADADSFIKAFDRYLRYQEVEDAVKQRNLLAVLFKDAAADWFESLADGHKNNIGNLRTAFADRYQTPEALKFKSASEIFTRKQRDDESVDDYILYMRKLGKLISADDNILRFAIINGLKPYISAQVTQARSETIDDILNVARRAELTLPRVMMTAGDNSVVAKQLAELTEDVRRLTTYINKATTTKIESRSPTPERRVRFAGPSSPSTNDFRSPSVNYEYRSAHPNQRMGKPYGPTFDVAQPSFNRGQRQF